MDRVLEKTDSSCHITSLPIVIGVTGECGDRVVSDVALKAFGSFVTHIFSTCHDTPIVLVSSNNVANRLIALSEVSLALSNVSIIIEETLGGLEQCIGLCHCIFALAENFQESTCENATLISNFRTGQFGDGHSNTLDLPQRGFVYTARSEPCTGFAAQTVAEHPIQFRPLPPLHLGREQSLFEEADLWSAFKKIDYFNRAFKQSSLSHKCTGQSGDFVEGTIKDVHDFADACATSLSSNRRRVQVGLIFLALISAICHLAYGGVADGWVPLAVGLVTLGTAFVLYFVYARSDLETKVIEYRALSEISRVALQWRKAGVAERLSFHLLRQTSDPYDWLRLASRSLDLLLASPHSEIQFDESRNASLRWIDGQVHYFGGAEAHPSEGKSGYHAKRARAIGLATKLLLSAAIGLAILTLAFDALSPSCCAVNHAQISLWLIYLYWILLAIAGVAATYGQIMGHAEHAQEYPRMLARYQIASHLVRAVETGSNEGIALVVRNLGIASLVETSGWLLLHRKNPVRVPI